jgi:hypothetical protein
LNHAIASRGWFRVRRYRGALKQRAQFRAQAFTPLGGESVKVEQGHGTGLRSIEAP